MEAGEETTMTPGVESGCPCPAIATSDCREAEESTAESTAEEAIYAEGRDVRKFALLCLVSCLLAPFR